MSGSPELRCENVTVRFGALIAVDRVSLDCPGRGLHSIIGPNGAGKTTLINVLSGRQRPKDGRVLLGGRDVTARSAFERARLGIGRSFQLTRIFPTLTVFENLRLGAQARAFRVQPFWRAVEGFAVLSDAASRVVAEIGLEHLRDRAADQLSHG
ncbi:MAG: ATP-binding cassette domain-containing protein, partial [Rhodospirillales bacterium]|nr:ATP-binding cassette domain-containing protein [Rhodospirillales bacterium]